MEARVGDSGQQPSRFGWWLEQKWQEVLSRSGFSQGHDWLFQRQGQLVGMQKNPQFQVFCRGLDPPSQWSSGRHRINRFLLQDRLVLD